MLSQRWKMNATFWKFEIFAPGNVADFIHIVSFFKRQKSLWLKGLPPSTPQKDWPSRSSNRWVVLKSKEMRTRFMPWSTCLSSQEILIQYIHIYLSVYVEAGLRRLSFDIASTVKLKPSSAQWDFGKNSSFSFQGLNLWHLWCVDWWVQFLVCSYYVCGCAEGCILGNHLPSGICELIRWSATLHGASGRDDVRKTPRMVDEKTNGTPQGAVSRCRCRRLGSGLGV